MTPRTGSVWAASMLHTSHNLFWLILSTLFADRLPAAKVITGDMSLAVAVFYAVLTLYLWKRANRGAQEQAGNHAA
ncbi:hypothetical protein G5B47_21595 [Paenibacillus sp. 7124]|uniref:CPBP family intramembrane metalloprotease n=2 Tax=Paenibacillus apii TaxID=1850370 RepID=A0A6M1PN74_9BACL|nr:hypothetical protein [Paenibacillus apii]NGM84999.1 hypothetical protein [Paenibacillus apii]